MTNKDFTPTIPPLLTQYQDIIQATKKEFIKITPHVSQHPLSPIDSKFGGVPYVIDFDNYPRDEEGGLMKLYAQINFSQLTAQGITLPDFPTLGILQFFNSDDTMYGLEGGAKVIYIADISKPSFINDEIEEISQNDMAPMECEHALYFEKTFEYAGLPDTLASESYDFINDLNEAQTDALYTISNFGSKLGGYAAFTQSDPREYDENIAHLQLLFQLDSQEGQNEIMWGDSGIGNWFISYKDLKNKNFDSVYFTWDCM